MSEINKQRLLELIMDIAPGTRPVRELLNRKVMMRINS